ncbi:nitroreductase family protein [Bradyrhizobium sp. Gha]|uniref:nitroreductase family protein n=1 Tax=Bradyrhizobium sp. Gha TaxID=1855318 RepID=UPI0008E3A2FA|nr:nitroreductase family protein [Bradyrhizobium sp. Gha]SFJ52753.1 Nitroreductase family protein [Bradyrhizobium sp. Gha]
MLAKNEMDTTSTFRSWRAIRSYAPELLEKNIVQELIDAAIQAPTALHLEPWAFAAIQDKERLRQYSDGAKTLLLEHQQATSFFQGHEPRALMARAVRLARKIVVQALGQRNANTAGRSLSSRGVNAGTARRELPTSRDHHRRPPVLLAGALH